MRNELLKRGVLYDSFLASMRSEDLICTNSESEYLSDFVDKNHVCVDWEGKDGTEDD